jgi:hypothetical protein
MKRTLYLDCFAGISGDMFIGALLACGLDFAHLKRELAKLSLTGYELTLDTVDRSGIAAQKFDVIVQQPELTDDPAHAHTHADGRTHSHAHGADEHSHHRSLSEIKRMIADSGLSETVKTRAQQLFQRIGEAESKIHNLPIESVHFHEVGAVDSIIDVVGACIGLEALQINCVLSSPLHVGFGTFKCAHGIYPVPGPATTELLQGVPIYAKDIEGELVTPTGAALVAAFAEGYGNLPAMRIERTGYGAGTRVYEKFPNVLRAIIGTLESEGGAGWKPAPQNAGGADFQPAPPDADTITVIETNLDDVSPQVLGYVMEQALTEGALDLFYTPVQMKKNRPGVLLTLLCQPSDRERMCALLFKETTTLGVRHRNEARTILQRSFVTVETAYGAIRVKVAKTAEGQVLNAAPEFEDCRAAAERHQVAVREVQLAAIKNHADKN